MANGTATRGRFVRMSTHVWGSEGLVLITDDSEHVGRAGGFAGIGDVFEAR